MSFDKNKLRAQITLNGKKYSYYDLNRLEKAGVGSTGHLPYSIRILLESAVRNCDGFQVTEEDVLALAGWTPKTAQKEISFKPGRVILQDFTGVPCVVDLAAMRSQMKRMGQDTGRINPQVPCDLVIDHSLQVDAFGSPEAFAQNTQLEFSRNRERYEFLKWGQNTLDNFRVVPPAAGIIHQVNLERLATGVLKRREGRDTVLFPDSLVGTDSHTTMINGIGIVGWGVGGIEAEAVMLGEPLCMVMPEVIGFRLTGAAKEGVTATDIVLTITEILRKKGVVDKFVEFFGPGVRNLNLADRATISNMCPEYGATIGVFPVDEETLRYYRLTGRSREAGIVHSYFKTQGLFAPYSKKEPVFSDILELDLGRVEPCLAGPKRPQDRVAVSELKNQFNASLTAQIGHKGFGLTTEETRNFQPVGTGYTRLTHGSVVLAAITSCTNTSNPSVMLGAGLLARNAVKAGLSVKPTVKTSLTPGSQVVDVYLRSSGLMPFLEKLGFHNAGYGCATCIGNSGSLPADVSAAIEAGKLVAASVTSGNRNFEGRINPHVRANYLASPMLVVAYALAGTVAIDLTSDPLGRNERGEDIYLRDIWPSNEQINECVSRAVKAAIFRTRYSRALKGTDHWKRIKTIQGQLYQWNPESTYIQEPPYFTGMGQSLKTIRDITGARALVMLGDSVTTDHISPAGNISAKSPAGLYLQNLGVKPEDFNSYGSRRGNDRVMTRGTFANIRLKNRLAPGTEGSFTTHFPSAKVMSIFDASAKYKESKTPLLALAGKEYGTGSSRDWAAKGPALLGISAVIAESFERIHRSNLAGMGILPLQFNSSENAETLKISGDEVFDITGLNESLKPRQELKVTARTAKGEKTIFSVIVRLDTPLEISYYRNGGILPTVLRKLQK